ncbi:MAG: RNA polymerase sigma-54 factor, partial [Spirochaetaceae bacterium]|nr:RNA polymerase sigma-54 factor [Spirochaetaceae bacterium]
MRQLHSTGLIQEQKLSQRMSPQLIQSIKLMELPIADLRDRIEEELEKNPALEVLKDKALVSLDRMYKPGREEDDYFEATSDSGYVRSGRGEAASDERRQFIEGVLAQSETLQEHLLWQLRLQMPAGGLRSLCEKLIQNIDGDGFNLEPPESLYTGPSAVLEKALDFVHRLDPPGCCTSGYEDALAKQADILCGGDAENVRRLIPCLSELERGKFLAAARKTSLSEDEVVALFSVLKSLSPFPGRQWTSGSAAKTRFV